MKKLLVLFLFIPLISFSQEDIERYKVYDTENIYTSLLLDTATGKIWQLQIGLTKANKKDEVDQMKTVLNDYEYAQTLEQLNEGYDEDYAIWEERYNSKPDSIVSAESKDWYKPLTAEEKLELPHLWKLAQNGRFKLYPTDNRYNFIMVDVIDGRTWQVQWNVDEDKRLVFAF